MHTLSASDSNIAGLSKSMDSMDKLHDKLKKESDELAQKIKDAEERTKEAEQKNHSSASYIWPIVGGAILGMGLAYWLKNRKK